MAVSAKSVEQYRRDEALIEGAIGATYFLMDELVQFLANEGEGDTATKVAEYCEWIETVIPARPRRTIDAQ